MKRNRKGNIFEMGYMNNNQIILEMRFQKHKLGMMVKTFNPSTEGAEEDRTL